MIEISPSVQIDERDLQLDFVRASGPGGQNVNKVATAAQLRFDVRASSLPEEAKTRLMHLAGNRVSREGVLLIEAKRFRTQEQNREDAIQRFVELVRKALAAGGKAPNPPQDHGFMYGWSFYDPDGHHWEVISMDPKTIR